MVLPSNQQKPVLTNTFRSGMILRRYTRQDEWAARGPTKTVRFCSITREKNLIVLFVLHRRWVPDRPRVTKTRRWLGRGNLYRQVYYIQASTCSILYTTDVPPPMSHNNSNSLPGYYTHICIYVSSTNRCNNIKHYNSIKSTYIVTSISYICA